MDHWGRLRGEQLGTTSANAFKQSATKDGLQLAVNRAEEEDFCFKMGDLNMMQSRWEEGRGGEWRDRYKLNQ